MRYQQHPKRQLAITLNSEATEVPGKEIEHKYDALSTSVHCGCCQSFDCLPYIRYVSPIKLCAPGLAGERRHKSKAACAIGPALPPSVSTMWRHHQGPSYVSILGCCRHSRRVGCARRGSRQLEGDLQQRLRQPALPRGHQRRHGHLETGCVVYDHAGAVRRALRGTRGKKRCKRSPLGAWVPPAVPPGARSAKLTRHLAWALPRAGCS